MKYFFSYLISTLILTGVVVSEEKPYEGEWKYYGNFLLMKSMAADENNIWIGSQGGLAQYIKESGKLIRYDINNSGLASNFIMDLAIDQKGVLWALCINGVSYFDGEKWGWLNEENSGLPRAIFSHIAVDNDGRVFIGHNQNGVYYYEKGKWNKIFFEDEVDTRHCRLLSIDASGAVVISAFRNMYTLEGGKPEFYFKKDTLFPSNSYLDRLGNLWFVHNKGVSYGKPGGKLKHISKETLDSVALGYYISDVAVAPDGIAWFITSSHVIKYDGKEWERIDTLNTGLNDMIIHDIEIDEEGVAWLALKHKFELTYGSFIHRYKSKDDWENIPLKRQDSISLFCFDIAPYGEESFWMNPGSSYFFNYSDGDFDIFERNTEKFPFFIQGFFELDKDGNLIMGPGFGKLAVYNGEDWAVYDDDSTGLPSDGIRDIYISRENDYWIVNYISITRYNGISWLSYDIKSFSDSPDSVEIVASEGGNIYVGSLNNGVYIFDGQGWENLNLDNSIMPSNNVYDIAIDYDMKAWIATDSGLVVADGKNLELFNMANSPLPSDKIYGAAFEPANQGSTKKTWIVCDSGLVALNIETEEWKVWDRFNSPLIIAGFLNPNVSIFYDADSSNLWINTFTNGVFKLKPEEEEDPSMVNEALPSADYGLACFPNPANNTIRADFYLGKPTYCELSLYGISGEFIKEIISGSFNEGNYSFTFDSKGLQNGAYFLSLAAKEGKQLKKIIIKK